MLRPQIGTSRPALSQAHACLIWRSLKNERRRCHNDCIPFLSAKEQGPWIINDTQPLRHNMCAWNLALEDKMFLLHSRFRLITSNYLHFLGPTEARCALKSDCCVSSKSSSSKANILSSDCFLLHYGKLALVRWAMFPMSNCWACCSIQTHLTNSCELVIMLRGVKYSGLKKPYILRG